MIKASDLFRKPKVVDLARKINLRDSLKHRLQKLVDGKRERIQYFIEDDGLSEVDLLFIDGEVSNSPDWKVVKHYDRDTNALMAMTITIATPIEEAEPIEVPAKPTASKKKKTSTG